MYQVVIVDDDDLALATLRRLVTIWGYEAITFTGFEDARAYLATHTPDALVVDVRLGSYNGLQLVHLARQSSPDMPIVVVSGFDDAVLRVEAQRADAVYLVKPFDMARLRQHLPGELESNEVGNG